MTFEIPKGDSVSSAGSFAIPKGESTGSFKVPENERSGARSQRKGGTSGIGAALDAAAFSYGHGWKDSYMGIKQIAEGLGADVDLDAMSEDERQLMEYMRTNPWSAWTGYALGLATDPVSWAATLTPLGWLNRMRQVSKVRGLIDKAKLAAQNNPVKARIATGAATGAGVGSIGYLPDDAYNPITGEKLSRLDMALMGGVGGAAIAGGSKLASDKWSKPGGRGEKVWK